MNNYWPIAGGALLKIISDFNRHFTSWRKTLFNDVLKTFKKYNFASIHWLGVLLTVFL